MKLKLEITSQALTPKQKGLITEKLEEIKAIVKENALPSKDENLCEKVKFNQQEAETITACYNKVAELLGWKSLDSSKVFIYLLNK